MNVLTRLVFIFIIVQYVENARILVVFPMHSHSHFTLGFSLVQELVRRGHEVSFINAYPQKTPIQNLEDVSVACIKKELDDLKNYLFQLEAGSPISNYRYMNYMGSHLTNLSCAAQPVQNVINSGEKFDLVFVEHFVNEAQFALAHHFGVPLVILSPMPLSILNSYLFANPAPSAYVQNLFASFTNNMNFWERLKNTYYNLMQMYYLFYEVLPRQRLIMERYFPNAPSFDNVLYNSSLMLINSHPSFSDPVPLLPNIIEIGGYHVLPPKKLPKDLQLYLDSARNGVVLFSMGSILNSNVLTKDKQLAIIKAFSKIDKNVLWKFDGKLENLPANIKVLKWIPQNDILAHPNVVLFVTHGGLLSSIETIYHGVPTIGIPVFSDQKMNVASAVRKGYAKSIPFSDLTEERLSEVLKEMLTNPKYMENAKVRSKIFHDQQVKPLDKAIFWLEYVIRHKGAFHLQPAVAQMPWYKRELVDVIGCCFVVLCSLIFLIIKSLRLFSNIFDKTKMKIKHS